MAGMNEIKLEHRGACAWVTLNRPERMKGSATSPLSAVFQPSVIVHKSRSDSSSTGSPSARIFFAQAAKRSALGGLAGAASAVSFCQSFELPT